MKTAAHITFFYNADRITYLNQVVESLLDFDADVYIYTNQRLDIYDKNEKVNQVVYPYDNKGLKIKTRHLFGKSINRKYVHPFYLAWENRDNIQSLVEDYEIQIYLEDDIHFTEKNLNYWLANKEKVNKKGFNLGFLRVEYNDQQQPFITDVDKVPGKIVKIDSDFYLLNDVNPYYGFWIYAKSELKEFMRSKEWKFKIKEYKIRERSAIGWHGINMNRYKGSLIPLIEKESHYETQADSSVHHLPNNYIDHHRWCTIKFPIQLDKDTVEKNEVRF